MVEDNNLGCEVSSSFRWVAFRISSYITTTQFLYRDVLDIETYIVSRHSLLQSFMVHFNRLYFSGDVRWGKDHNHTRF
ncbi:unnamed protein product [Acanthoscelides obtectus]|uniref:Uncharacterized protein n=1 Tax=Acanthoscelides obtectus TaxID=200917 RepID=A0A9P0P1N6_ACAOB|nr:unnamed protein product [Acanthoscelides obtectus]CAK1627464.1 hypothetical protein AOBTE_LOCUS4617 [Acanthoscelides obtectus]